MRLRYSGVMLRLALIVLSLTCLAITGCDVPAEASATVHLSVEGMTCEKCVAAVEHALEGVDGVVSCEVSLDDESATIQVSDPSLGPTLAATVNDLRYVARVVTDDPADP